jgi:hypothetical protein
VREYLQIKPIADFDFDDDMVCFFLLRINLHQGSIFRSFGSRQKQQTVTGIAQGKRTPKTNSIAFFISFRKKTL